MRARAAVVEWARSHLGGCGLDYLRVRLRVGDVRDAFEAADGGFDAVCLDVDNGPGWLVHEDNAALYTDAGIDRLHACLRPWAGACACGRPRPTRSSRPACAPGSRTSRPSPSRPGGGRTT